MAVCSFCEKMLGNDTESLGYNNYCYYSDPPTATMYKTLSLVSYFYFRK